MTKLTAITSSIMDKVQAACGGEQDVTCLHDTVQRHVDNSHIDAAASRIQRMGLRRQCQLKKLRKRAARKVKRDKQRKDAVRKKRQDALQRSRKEVSDVTPEEPSLFITAPLNDCSSWRPTVAPASSAPYSFVSNMSKTNRD